MFIEENGGTKNGYYRRSIKTNYGEMEDLSVPRDREGNFRTGIFDPYTRSIGIEELVISLYSKGIFTIKALENLTVRK